MGAERQPWDAGRLLKTLAYYRVVPFLGCLDWLQQRTKKGTNVGKKTVLLGGSAPGNSPRRRTLAPGIRRAGPGENRQKKGDGSGEIAPKSSLPARPEASRCHRERRKI